MALKTIAKVQAHVTTTTMGEIVWLLNYATNHSDVTFHYHDSDMILHVSSGASYLYENVHAADPAAILSLPTNLSKMATNSSPSSPKMESSTPLCQLIKTVMYSVAED